MDENLEKMNGLIGVFSSAVSEIITRTRAVLMDRGIPPRVSDMVLVNGTISALSKHLSLVAAQLTGDLNEEKAAASSEEIFKEVSLAIRDILAKHTGRPIAFVSEKKTDRRL